MPKKPTEPFAYLNFSKSGRVSKHVTQLSDTKSEQEMQVGVRFVEGFNGLGNGRKIAQLRPLAEADQDFSAYVSGVPLQVQLTELVDRSYTFEMTMDEYNAGQFHEAIQKGYGAMPQRIDPELRDDALWVAIAGKLRRRYAAPEAGEFWLVVFTTQALYLTECVEAGVPRVSEALRRARSRLVDYGPLPFTEVWFTNLQNRPVRVWPVGGEVAGEI
jgi:hypothetical protein